MAPDGVPGERRDGILQLLRDSPSPRSIASLADELGVHENTIRFHLDSLIRAGRVEQVSRGQSAGPGRPPILFLATRRMDPAGPTNYRLLATILTAYLASGRDPAATAKRLGRSFGPSLVDQRAAAGRPSKERSVADLVDVLDDLGFKPERPKGPRAKEIRLRHCPFNAVVDRQGGDVVCAVHLGLMQGALSAMRAPVTVDRLDPFVEPDLCVAHLARKESS
jgi:predicted ArsR family transcriptional regulator